MEDAKIIIKEYDSTKLSDKQLLNDWRIVVHWYGLALRSDKAPYSKDEVYALSKQVYNEIIERTTEGDMHYCFKPNKMTDHTRELYYKLSTKDTNACELCTVPTYEFPERNRIVLSEDASKSIFGEDNCLVVQKYCGGKRAMLCKSTDGVKLYVLGDGLYEDEQITSEAVALADCDYVLEGELLSGKFIANDIPYFKKPIHDQSWTNRKKQLNKLTLTTHIRGSYPFIIDNADEFVEIVDIISKTPDAKGVLVFKSEIKYGDKKLELVTYGEEETGNTIPNTTDNPTDEGRET